MIQFNLLPDVKLEYIKAQRARQLAMSVSFVVAAAALGLLILAFSFGQLQKKHIADLDADIASATKKLKSEKDISRVLTVQNQLASVSTLHDKKPAASRLFTYFKQLPPQNTTITGMSIDFTQQTLTLNGTANSLTTVNTFVDTLKYAKFTTKTTTTKTPAFKDIVLSSFAVSSDNKDGQAATFTITLTADPTLFTITEQPDITVPNRVTGGAGALSLTGGTE